MTRFPSCFAHLFLLTLVSLFSACAYPEVDEGGYGPPVDAGPRPDGGGASGAIAWCTPGFNIPCACMSDYLPAVQRCTPEFEAIRSPTARSVMAGCLNGCINGSCGTSFCGCASDCNVPFEASATSADRAAIAAAYGCAWRELRTTCPSLP